MNNHSLVSDSWTELIQSSCQKLEVEEIQPLGSKTLDETLHFLKRLWAYSVLCPKSIPSDLIFQACRNPLAKDHPIGRVLSAILLKKLGLPTPPLVAIHPLMPFFESCQLVLLWAVIGEEKAFSFASKLLPLAHLPTLWCKEEEFSEHEMQLSIALLKRAFGYEVEVPKGPIDPFFGAVAKNLPSWEKPPSMPHRVVDSELGLSFQRGEKIIGAMALTGEKTGLGAFQLEGMEVRACGPQVLPFSDPKGFGILRAPDSQPVERWTAVAGMPEVWMEANICFEREEIAITTRFFGQKVDRPIYFSFYVKAPRAQVGEEFFYPCTLKRYEGQPHPALFGEKIKIESLLPGKMELIPLAGEGGFWNCDFLLAFEVPSFEGKGEYRLRVVAPKLEPLESFEQDPT